MTIFLVILTAILILTVNISFLYFFIIFFTNPENFMKNNIIEIVEFTDECGNANYFETLFWKMSQERSKCLWWKVKMQYFLVRFQISFYKFSLKSDTVIFSPHPSMHCKKMPLLNQITSNIWNRNARNNRPNVKKNKVPTFN